MSKFLFITQVYPPDPAAVGQQIEDAAGELANRGHEIIVYTADRDYDEPKIRYDTKSRYPGVRIIRIPFSSFGKRTIFHRLLGQFSFLSQCALHLLFARKVNGVLLTTIPATTGVFFLLVRMFRRFPYLYWVMDINPDQAIALGAFTENSFPARVLGWVNNRLLKSANQVICLDTDMAKRLGESENVEIIPPWPLEEDLEIVSKDENPFIKKHGLKGNFVFMYSGNHSLVHPLTTLLDAIDENTRISKSIFAFIGGGRGKAKVETRRTELESKNILSLPYQALDQIKYSLSAADVQIVSFGNEMVGIVHPCKLYSAMAIGKPILLLGPKYSALGRIVLEHQIGWCVSHEDQKEMKRLLEEIPKMTSIDLNIKGNKAKQLVVDRYSRARLCGNFCDIFESTFAQESTNVSFTK